MLKSVLLGGVTALCVVTSAVAADMPVKATPMYQNTGTMASNWTGLYMGINVGYGSNDTSFDATGFTGDNSTSASSILGGAQIGYNYQFAPHLVVGLETDYNRTGIKSTNAFGNTGLDVSQPWFGTTRLKAGVPTGNLLIYGTGGVAYGQTDVSSPNGSVNVPTVGWTGGVGLEYAIPGTNLTLAGEYLHVVLKGPAASFTGGNSISTDSTTEVGRIKINYRF